MTHDPSVLSCSFCNKTQAEVRKLIAGPAVFICDECVEICMDIIRADDAFPELVHESSRPPVEPLSEPHSTRIVTCKLCDLPMPWEEALLIPSRGFLCPACSGEVQAALEPREE